MKSKLFVGGLPFTYSNAELKALFTGVGTVVSAEMVLDPDRGRTRGFGFVELSTPEQAQEAIASLNNTPLAGKNIYVTVARDKPAPKPAPTDRKFPKTPNRKMSRDFRQDPRAPGAGEARFGRPAFGDSRQGPPSTGARPAWPPPAGRRFDKPPRRYKGNRPFDRSAPPAFGAGRPARPAFGEARHGRPAAPGAGPRSPSGFSKPKKWEPRGNDKNAFSPPRRERGDFGPSRPTHKPATGEARQGRPAKKEFWRKFDKKKPRPE